MVSSQSMKVSKQIALFFLFLFFFFSAQISAKPVSVEQVRKVVGTFLEAQNIRHEKQLKMLQKGVMRQALPTKFAATGIKEIHGDDRKVLAYVTKLEPEGFLITAADDGIRPILGYSFKGNFPFEDSKQNVLLHLVQWDIEARLRALSIDTLEIKNLVQFNNNSWNTYASRNKGFVQTLVGDSQAQWPDPTEYGYEGWIKTNWHQGWPYNRFCPLDPDELNRSFVGCVATAAAQIINYWHYPHSIRFNEEDSYWSWNYGNPRATLKVAFIDSHNSLLDFPNFDELNSALDSIAYDGNEVEIAYFCFAARIKHQMQYSSVNSNASLMAHAYKNGFEYGSAIEHGWRFGLNWPDYEAKVTDNVKNGWPVQIGIIGSGIGHSVIVDGYKATGEFHINSGWGGTGDWWYFLPTIDTHNAPIPGLYSFSVVSHIIYDISPYQGWSQWGADERNSFRTPYMAPTTNPPVDKWYVQCPGTYYFEGLVVGTGNKIYAACSPRFTHDVDIASVWVINQYGEKKQEIQLTDVNDRVFYPVQNKSGDVFIATASGKIYKIDPVTEVATLYFTGPYGDTFYGLKVDSEGWLYAYTPNRLYFIISPIQVWSFFPGGGSQFYPENGIPAINVETNRVYVSYYNSSTETAYLGCLDRLTGSPACSPKTFPNITNASKSTGPPSIGPAGNVYVGCDTKLYAFNDQSLDVWPPITPGISAISHAPTISKDGTIYLAYWKNDTDYIVAAIDSTNKGEVKWEILFQLGDYDRILDVYAASNKVVIFTIHRLNDWLNNDDDTYTIYAYKDKGDRYEYLWKKEFGESGGKTAFGPGATIYVIPSSGYGHKIHAISEGPRSDPDSGGMGFTNNAAPLIPTNPDPAEGTDNLSTIVTLSWDCSDPENHALRYSLFVGESGYDMVPVATDLTDESYTLSGLKPGTGHAWKIIATDGQAVTEGPTWVFSTATMIGDFCGTDFGPPDGYVDVWDLMRFADHWHSRTGDANWDSKFDLTGPNFGDLDGYVDVWDLMEFANHWHEGRKP